MAKIGHALRAASNGGAPIFLPARSAGLAMPFFLSVKIAAGAVSEPEHVISHICPASGFLPEIGWVQGGKKELLRTYGIELLAVLLSGVRPTAKKPWALRPSRAKYP